jgi:hypothetical protein
MGTVLGTKGDSITPKNAQYAILTPEQALLAIQELLSGVEWSVDTLGYVAEILDNAGYEIKAVEDAG